MGSHKGALRLTDMNLYHGAWVIQVYRAYHGVYEEHILQYMDDEALRLLWEKRPKDIEKGDLTEEVIFEFNPEEARLEALAVRYGPDGRLNTHHRDTADSAWNK